MPFRIISFDGGAGTATYLRYLRAFERDHLVFFGQRRRLRRRVERRRR